MRKSVIFVSFIVALVLVIVTYGNKESIDTPKINVIYQGNIINTTIGESNIKGLFTNVMTSTDYTIINDCNTVQQGKTIDYSFENKPNNCTVILTKQDNDTTMLFNNKGSIETKDLKGEYIVKIRGRWNNNYCSYMFKIKVVP